MEDENQEMNLASYSTALRSSQIATSLFQAKTPSSLMKVWETLIDQLISVSRRNQSVEKLLDYGPRMA